MRIDQLIWHLDEALKFSKFEVSVETINGAQVFVFGNTANVKAFISNLESTDLFADHILSIKISDLYIVSGDVVKVSHAEGSKLQRILGELVDYASYLSSALKQISGPAKPNENEIYIKLPPLKDFDDLSKIAEKLQGILTQILFVDNIGAEIKIEGAENGSIWFRVMVGTTIAVQLLGSITWSAAVIYKKVQEGKIFEEMATQQKYKSSDIEKLMELNRFQINLLVAAEANYIYDKHLRTEVEEAVEHEKIERLKHSIEQVSVLIGEGAEIQATLAAPESVGNLFPDMKNLPTIASKIKQIENKK